MHRGINIVLGDNGQGKTNFLEAIYFVLTGNSFRTNDIDNLLGPSEHPKTIVRSKAKKLNLDLDITGQILENRKSHFLGTKPTNSSQLSKNFPIVVFDPDSLNSIKGGPETRRTLLDNLGSQIILGYWNVLNDFKKVLKQRNSFLKKIKEGELKRVQYEILLETLTQQFVDKSVEIVQLRLQAIQEIQPDLQRIFREVTGQTVVTTEIEYLVSNNNATSLKSQEIRDLLVKRSQELRLAELSSGTSLFGPHKHDIKFLYNRKDSRFFCSQGQQRALILAFKMAQIVYHYQVKRFRPILLLDDVLSELDKDRQLGLLEFLRNCESQTILSSTALDVSKEFCGYQVREFHVSGGEVQNVSSESAVETVLNLNH